MNINITPAARRSALLAQREFIIGEIEELRGMYNDAADRIYAFTKQLTGEEWGYTVVVDGERHNLLVTWLTNTTHYAELQLRYAQLDEINKQIHRFDGVREFKGEVHAKMTDIRAQREARKAQAQAIEESLRFYADN